MKTSVAIVARAIRKNGFKQAFGSFDDGKGGRCALGQGAVNLKVDPNDLLSALNEVTSGDGEQRLGDTIMEWNDENKWSLTEIANRIERDWTDSLNTQVVV